MFGVITSDVQLVPPRDGCVVDVGAGNVCASAREPAVVDRGDPPPPTPGRLARSAKRKNARFEACTFSNRDEPLKPLPPRLRRRPLPVSSPSGADVRAVLAAGGGPAVFDGRSYAASVGRTGVRGVVTDPVRNPTVATTPRTTRRAPRTAVVCIRRGIDGPDYAQILRSARERVNLAEIGVTDSRIRWAANGSILIEVSGIDKKAKADLLATRLREALAGEANVTRPIATGEIRIWGLDDSISVDEVKCTVADLGGCLPEEVGSGSVVKMPNRLGMVWIRCPLEAAVKVASGGKLRIGWTNARVELLRARPLQCFKCWQYGHVSDKCKTDIDRSRACFGCGGNGHIARGCSASPRCLVCEKAGKAADHRMGSQGCEIVPRPHSEPRNRNGGSMRRGSSLSTTNNLPVA